MKALTSGHFFKSLVFKKTVFKFPALPGKFVALAALCALIQTSAAATQEFKVIATINVDVAPFGATLAPDGKTVWVANCGTGRNPGHTVTIIDADTLTEAPEKIAVGNFPEDIAFSGDGARAFVTNSSDATVSVIDVAYRTATRTVSLAPLNLAFPFGIAVNKNNQEVFVTTTGVTNDQSIAVLDNDRGPLGVQLDGTVMSSGFVARPELRPAGNELVVPTSTQTSAPPLLLVIDPGSRHIKGRLTLEGSGAFPQDIAITPDGRFAYISLFEFSNGTGGVWVVDLRELKTVTVINTGDPFVFGMGMTPDGRFIFATNFLQNQVAVIDPKANTVIATVPVGHQPNKVAVTLDGRKAFVTNQGDTTVSVIGIPGD